MLPQHQRKPGFFERFYLCRNIGKYYRNFNVTAEYNQRIEIVLLSNALRSLILKNPLFCTNFYREGSPDEDKKMDCANFTLKTVNKIEFGDVVKFRKIEGEFGEEQVYELSEEEFSCHTSTPLWKMFVLENDSKQYISFVCEHTLFDGNSGAQFHADLIKELGDFSGRSDLVIQETLFDYAIDKSELAPLVRSSDKITDLFNCSLRFWIVEIIKELCAPKWLQEWFNYFTLSGYSNPLKRSKFTVLPTSKETKSKFRLINLSADKLKALLDSCKKEGLTLTPYVTALAMQSLQETIFKQVSSKQYYFDTDLDIDGRRYFPEAKEETRYGLYASVLESRVDRIPPSKDGFKIAARQLQLELSDAVKSRKPFASVGLLQYVKAWDVLEGKLGKHSRVTIETSNLGRKDFSHKGWSINNLIFTQPCGILQHFCLSIISTKTEGMNICLTYIDEYDSIIPDEAAMIDEFISDFKNRLSTC